MREGHDPLSLRGELLIIMADLYAFLQILILRKFDVYECPEKLSWHTLSNIDSTIPST